MSNNELQPIKSDLPEIIPQVDRMADFLQFAQWSATPKALRRLKTQKAFAIEIRIDEDTLTNWKRHQCFWPLVFRLTMESMKTQVADVTHALYLKARRKGNAKDVEYFLRLAGMTINSNNNEKNY